MFNEVKVPFSLADLPDGEELPLADVDAFIPYLTEKWPENGRPHHIELFEASGRKPPAGVDGWIVFRVSAPEPERDPDAPEINWDRVLQERTASIDETGESRIGDKHRGDPEYLPESDA